MLEDECHSLDIELATSSASVDTTLTSQPFKEYREKYVELEKLKDLKNATEELRAAEQLFTLFTINGENLQAVNACQNGAIYYNRLVTEIVRSPLKKYYTHTINQ